MKGNASGEKGCAYAHPFLFNGRLCPMIKEIKMKNITMVLLVLLTGCATSFPRRTLTPFSEKRVHECRAVSQEGVSYPLVDGETVSIVLIKAKLKNGYWCDCVYSWPSNKVPTPKTEEMRTSCFPSEGKSYIE